jgi:hypothetical protein
MAGPDIGKIKDPGEVAIDERARQQIKTFIAEGNRSNREKNAIHWAFVSLLFIGVLAFVYVLFAKVWHLTCSGKWAWLNKEQLEKIDNFITSGFIGVFVTSLFASKFKNPEKDN